MVNSRVYHTSQSPSFLTSRPSATICGPICLDQGLVPNLQFCDLSQTRQSASSKFVQQTCNLVPFGGLFTRIMDGAEVAVVLNGTQVRTEIYLPAVFAVTAVWHQISAEYIHIMVASRFLPELLSVFADLFYNSRSIHCAWLCFHHSFLIRFLFLSFDE